MEKYPNIAYRRGCTICDHKGKVYPQISYYGLSQREKKTWGPPETAAPEAKEIWRNALKETEAKYPIGHPLLVAEATRARISQEETQKMIAHEIYLERRQALLEKWKEEYRREYPEEELEETEDTIFFNVPEAREHLISKGFVYTLRPKLRRTGKDVAYHGSYYKKEKIGDVLIEFVKEVKDAQELKEYLSRSGFTKVQDWWGAAEGSRFLYKVTFLKETPSYLKEPIKERAGLCYELAWRHISGQGEGTLIHGQLWSPKLDRLIDHAWVETETGYIYEPESDSYYPKDWLYKTYKVKEFNTYTPDQARIMALRSRNYGPWTDDERKAFLKGESYPEVTYKTLRQFQPQTVTELTPAITMSMVEFRKVWEPLGWRILIIGPTSTWRQDWGEWEAIRDIVQNSLDETEAYASWSDETGLWIRDQGRGIAVADFLLGPPKPKPPHARGKFGEGMKIAALALLRMGYPVKVETVGKEIWLLFLKVKVDGEAEQLAALWKPNGRRRGTVFHIIGYSGSDFKDRFAVNIPKGDILHEGPSQLDKPIRRFNQLIRSPPGRIYARDIFMREIDSPFSYNLWSFEMAPDRHGPKEESQMWLDMGRLWATCAKVDLLQRFLGMVTDPPLELTVISDKVSMGWMGTEPVSQRAYSDLMKDNARSWQAAWNKRIGSDVLMRTDDRWDSIVTHLGYKSMSVAWGVREALERVIRTDRRLIKESQERLRGVEVIPDEKLVPIQRAHLMLARKIAARWRYPPIAGVHAAIIPPASEQVKRTDGLYVRTTQEIFIAADQLQRAFHTVGTLIHEIAHHASGADDGDPLHNAEMSTVGALIVEAGARGDYDEELKEAQW